VAKRKNRVLVFYGGDNATAPRDALLVWLGKPQLNVEPRRVVDDPPHSEGTVDDRVDAAVAECDQAIALLTPDSRCPYGAPNVFDEIGRWRGSRGKDSICIVRDASVPPISNHAGIVYLAFDEHIRETFDRLRDFLHVEAPQASPAVTMTTASSHIYEFDGSVVLINGTLFNAKRVDEHPDRLAIELANIDGEGQRVLRDLQSQHSSGIEIAFGNKALSGNLQRCRLTQTDGVGAELEVRVAEPGYGSMVSFQGIGPNEISKRRAARILFDDEPRTATRGHSFEESFLAGGGDGKRAITHGRIPELLQARDRTNPKTWQRVRLELLLDLFLSACVRHVDALRLEVRDGRLARIELRAQRANTYASEQTPSFELARDVDF
jgi:Predicted nucleotide-binding protein containing TIR-like domain